MQTGFEWFVAWRYLRERGRRSGYLQLAVGALLLFTNTRILVGWGDLGDARWAAYGLVAGMVGAAAYAPRFERDAPQIILTPDSDVLGAGSLEILVRDQGDGLKSVTATLSAGGAENNLADEQ